DVDREVVPRRGPVRPVHDAHEEVRREERAEQHHLRRDEEEHSEQARVDARADVRDGRMEVRVVVLDAGVRFHYAGTPASVPATTCSTGTPAFSRRRSTRSFRSQPERSCGNVETMISSIRSSRTACIAAVYGSGCATWPCASMPPARSSATA